MSGCEDRFFCEGYRVEMSLFNCIENQLSDFCLLTFPCHECPAALTIRPAPVRVAPAPVKSKRGRLFVDFSDMTPAVRRSMGLG